MNFLYYSIVWLQNQRDQNAERSRSGGLGMGVGRGPGLGGRDDFHEFRVGRIKHERVKVSINDYQWFQSIYRSVFIIGILFL